MSNESDLTKSIREMLSGISNPLREHREWMASISDPLKEHRELITSMADPLKDHREWMASISDPLKEHRELIASMADPLKDHREWIASISDPLKEHRELIASMADPLKDHREWMASISDPLKEHRELIASMADPIKDYRELMASISDPLKEHRELIASISNPFKEINASILALTNPLKDISISDINSLISLKDIAAAISNDLSFESEGIISLDSKRVTASELQDLSIQLINNSSLKQSDTLEESLNALIEEIRSQKDPITQKLLMWFVFPLIITVIASFINPIVDAQVKSHLKQDKRSLSKKIESNFADSLSNKTLLKDFRYVTADVLNVRYSAFQKSKTIGYLYFGYAVIVLDRQKNWTLIEWNDPDSKVRMTGWVFSRYLARFR